METNYRFNFNTQHNFFDKLFVAKNSAPALDAHWCLQRYSHSQIAHACYMYSHTQCYSHTHATRTRMLLAHAYYSHTHATRTRDFTTTRSTINTFYTRVYRVEHTRVTREQSLGYSRALVSRTHSLVKLRLSGTVHVNGASICFNSSSCTKAFTIVFCKYDSPNTSNLILFITVDVPFENCSSSSLKIKKYGSTS